MPNNKNNLLVLYNENEMTLFTYMYNNVYIDSQ